MIIESLCADDTFAFGKKLGEAAEPGTVYTLVGDLGVGKTVLTQGLAEGLGITEAVNKPLRFCRSMRKDACRCITLTCTASAMWRKWTKSAMRIIFTGTVSA